MKELNIDRSYDLKYYRNDGRFIDSINLRALYDNRYQLIRALYAKPIQRFGCPIHLYFKHIKFCEEVKDFTRNADDWLKPTLYIAFLVGCGTSEKLGEISVAVKTVADDSCCGRSVCGMSVNVEVQECETAALKANLETLIRQNASAANFDFSIFTVYQPHNILVNVTDERLNKPILEFASWLNDFLTYTLLCYTKMDDYYRYNSISAVADESQKTALADDSNGWEIDISPVN